MKKMLSIILIFSIFTVFFGTSTQKARSGSPAPTPSPTQALDVDAITDANIDAYIQNKLKAADAAPVGPATEQAEDKSNFQTFMNSFKNTSGGKNRLIYKNIVKFAGGGDVDPFGFSAGILSKDDIKNSYDQFYTKTFITNNVSFDNNLKLVRAGLNDLNDISKPNSCADLTKDLQVSAIWSGTYSQVLGVVGGGAGAFFSGGLMAIGGAAIGYGVGSQVDAAIKSGNLKGAEKKLYEISKQFLLLEYDLYFMMFKEAIYGLHDFADKDTTKIDTMPEWGLNVYKSRVTSKEIDLVSKNFSECTKNVKAAVTDLANAGTGSELGPDGCPTISILKGFDPFNWAFCKMFRLLYDFLSWVVEQANKLALMSVGANFTK